MAGVEGVVQFQLHLSAKLFKQFQENCTCRTRQQHLGHDYESESSEANSNSEHSRSCTSVCECVSMGVCMQ